MTKADGAPALARRDPRADTVETATASWTRFRAGPLTLPETPGVREAWHRGRPRFAVWVLRVQEPAVRERAGLVAELLSDAIFPQPSSDLHVTVFVAGFPADRRAIDDDVLEEELAAQARAVGARGRAIDLRVGGASSFLSAPFLEVDDQGGSLARLRELLAEHAREIRFAPYHPHVTIGRYRDARDTRPLAARLQRWRELPPLELRLGELELVTFDALTPGAPLLTELRLALALSAATRKQILPRRKGDGPNVP